MRCHGHNKTLSENENTVLVKGVSFGFRSMDLVLACHKMGEKVNQNINAFENALKQIFRYVRVPWERNPDTPSLGFIRTLKMHKRSLLKNI
jgi:hypothetical protein